jgi:hypothetical protein
MRMRREQKNEKDIRWKRSAMSRRWKRERNKKRRRLGCCDVRNCNPHFSQLMRKVTGTYATTKGG